MPNVVSDCKQSEPADVANAWKRTDKKAYGIPLDEEEQAYLDPYTSEDVHKELRIGRGIANPGNLDADEQASARSVFGKSPLARAQFSNLENRRRIVDDRGGTMGKSLLLVGLIIAIFTVPAARSQTAVSPVPRDTVITLQQGACERRCAVYKVAIFGDGVVLFNGEYFVGHPGLTLDRVAVEAIGKLLEHAAAAGFFNMSTAIRPGQNEGCQQVTGDAPIVIVTIAANGRSNVVLHDRRCAGPEAAPMTVLEGEINAVANVSRKVR